MKRICKYCHKEFIVQGGELYCPECREKGLRAKRKPRATGYKRKYTKRTLKEVQVTCVTCGKEFTALSQKAMYCPECKKTYKRTWRKKKNTEGNGYHREQSNLIQCPFYKRMKETEILCECLSIKFEYMDEKKEHFEKYCCSVEKWIRCPIANKIGEAYGGLI